MELSAKLREFCRLFEDADPKIVRWVTTKSGSRFPIYDRPPSKSLEAPTLKMKRTLRVFTRKDGTTGHTYVYDPKHVRIKSRFKFQRTAALSQKRHSVISELENEVSDSALPAKDRMTALALLTIAATGARPGNKGAETAGRRTYGVTTLQARHVHVDGDTVMLRFRGKAGQTNKYKFTHPRAAAAYASILKGKASTDLVFQFADHSHGQVLDSHLRDRMAKIGGHFKVKDLRTAHANAVAAEAVTTLLKRKPRIPAGKTAQIRLFKKMLKTLAIRVSRQLNNQPGVALAKYIDPALQERFAQELGFTKAVIKGTIKEATGDEIKAFLKRAGYEYDRDNVFPALRYIFGDEAVEEALTVYASDDIEGEDDVPDDEVLLSSIASSVFGHDGAEDLSGIKERLKSAMRGDVSG